MRRELERKKDALFGDVACGRPPELAEIGNSPVECRAGGGDVGNFDGIGPGHQHSISTHCGACTSVVVDLGDAKPAFLMCVCVEWGGGRGGVGG